MNRGTGFVVRWCRCFDGVMTSFAQAVARGWDQADPDAPDATIDWFRKLLDGHPEEPQAIYEYASALDFAGREDGASVEYERAFAAGLSGDTLRRALIQYGSTLRNLGRHTEAVAALRKADELFPGHASVTAFLALALVSAGDGGAAVARLLELALDRLDDKDLRSYQRPLRAYAAELTQDPTP